MKSANPKSEIALRFTQIRDFFYGDTHGGAKTCADRVGFSPSVWSDFEGGRRNLTAENALRVHEAFGVSFRWLIRGEGEMFEGGIHEKTPPATASGEQKGTTIETVFRVQAALSMFGQYLAAGQSATSFPELPALKGTVQSLQEQLGGLIQLDKIQDRKDLDA